MKMARFNPIQCLACVLLWSLKVSGDSSTEDHRCHKVQREFIHKRIGSSALVPNNPIHDPSVSICFNGAKETGRKSCCTSQSEQKYVIASEKYLKTSIRTKNAYLKKLLLDHISQYEERIANLVQMSENSTIRILTDIYNIPRVEHQAIVQEFYGEIRQYLKHKKHMTLRGGVAVFFDKIFPAVYKNTLNDGTVTVLSQEHHNCLRHKRQEISPSPFGVLPSTISYKLSKALNVAKSYVEVLSLIVEAINTTDHLTINGKCKDQMTHLQYCSHCESYVEAKPCRGFCLNVMRGCLAQLSTLTPEWEGLIRRGVRLEGGMSQTNDIEKILNGVDRNIDAAVMHALESEDLYDRNMKALCNFQVTVSTKLANTTSSHHKERGHHHQAPLNRRSIGGDLYDQVLEVMKELLTSLRMFDTMSDVICDQELYYNQNMESDQCWNGTTIGRYTPLVEGLSAYVRAVNVDMDPKINTLKEKLSQMKINLLTRYSEQEELMFSDSEDPHAMFQGSGDTLRGHHSFTTDDEDLDGSGSGHYSIGGDEGSGGGDPDKPHEPVITRHPPNVDDGNREVNPQDRDGNTGAASHFTVSMAAMFISVVVAIFV
ncbi:glypican-5-like [Mizuhopecten yessoensis]|uniref:Glypican-5 n=1 Tax=Mizuhopecten yessoensis TaxID=6573 RepID=A0A210R0C3_MIZYE|nr:glypican-5-like [Mizuhopecten yessoensis]OWF54468.1 Glypican-5 [Mizuhopecten yessoensis]